VCPGELLRPSAPPVAYPPISIPLGTAESELQGLFSSALPHKYVQWSGTLPYMEVSGQLHAMAHLLSRKEPSVGPRTGLGPVKEKKNLLPLG
jgi:hypothetical protein